MKRLAAPAYVVALGAIGTAYLLDAGWLNSGPVFNAIGASTVAAILVGVRLHRPAARLPWYVFALGQALFVLGDVVAYNYEGLFGKPLPFPSLADPFYLGFYPALIAGLLVLLHRRNPRHDRASLIDSLIVFVGAAALSWVYLMAPYAHDPSLSLPTKLISMAYPLMDLLLLGVTARFTVGPGRRGAAYWLLALGILALLVTDAIYGWKLLHGGYETGGLLDGGWILFYALFGTAALHPSMCYLSEPAAAPSARVTRDRLALLAGATLVAPAVVTARVLLHQPIDVLVLTGASAALSLLVVGRLGGLMRDQEQAVERETALREAGEGLVIARTREGICAAALTAARALYGAHCEARVYLCDEGRGVLAAVAATDADVATLPVLPLSGPAPSGGAPLPAPVELGTDEPEVAAGAGWTSPLLVRGGQLRGILTVSSEEPAPRPVQEALDRLASQLALALESAAVAEEALRAQAEARLSSLVQNASDVVTIVLPDTSISYASPSAERVLGYRAEKLAAAPLVDYVHPDDAPAVATFVANGVSQSAVRPMTLEFRMRHRDGSWIHVQTLATNLLDDPTVGGIVLNMRDVSDRKAFEAQLAHQAFHDTLTGLPNRALFRNRVEHALERQRRGDGVVAVLFLDLDDFKAVNDSLGHAAGDQLLSEAGRRLARCVRRDDTAARLGGDEFAVLLDGVKSELEALEAAERAMAAIGRAIRVAGREVFVRTSVGVAFGDTELSGPAGAGELLRNADVAMYMAKERGKSRYQVFEPGMHTTVLERLELKGDLERALRNDEFTVEYQPIVELEGERIAGFEALVRWDHPTRGRIAPLDFIPLAEETGLIVPLGLRILDEACVALACLQASRPQLPPLTMAANVSGRQLQDPRLAARVEDVIARNGIPPGSLVLELTESVMMEDTELAVRRMQELRRIGVRLAIDDFGTGYSSLNYIRQFPIDVLKIDRSFIQDVAEGGEVPALTGAIIGLATVLGLDPIAEGIEELAQLRRLRELGCRFGQGYYFHEPLPAAALEQFARRETTGVGSG